MPYWVGKVMDRLEYIKGELRTAPKGLFNVNKHKKTPHKNIYLLPQRISFDFPDAFLYPQPDTLDPLFFLLPLAIKIFSRG